MRIHHLNCASFCVWGSAIPSACHCILIETDSDLVLVDTGLGCQDIQTPRTRLPLWFRVLSRPYLDRRETAISQIEQLGYDPRDVRHIILTHLDFDHGGGISDFPQARIHLLQPEFDAARSTTGWRQRQRYRPQQWPPDLEWYPYPLTGETWLGFQAVRSLQGLPPEILMVPLQGHSRGHAGVAVQTPQGWLFHAGDAYFHRDQMDPIRPSCPLLLSGFQWLIASDYSACVENQLRLRHLREQQGDSLQLCCSHDLLELQKLQQIVSHPA